MASPDVLRECMKPRVSGVKLVTAAWPLANSGQALKTLVICPKAGQYAVIIIELADSKVGVRWLRAQKENEFGDLACLWTNNVVIARSDWRSASVP